jgi:hypothetical protein
MCVKPITITNKYRSQKSDKHLITVPCGKCYKCINKKRREWAFRLNEEAKQHANVYLLTLTYSEEYVPYLNLETGEYPVRAVNLGDDLQETDRLEKIVYKKDVQNFIKRVRKAQTQFYKKCNQEPRKIRYYACSEYGTKNTKRPHYHIILFSAEPYIIQDWQMLKLWKFGAVDIEPMNREVGTYYYTTKYLFKQRQIRNTWTFKPFSLMSTKPFIGYSYIEQHKARHFQNRDLFTRFNDKEIIIPKIYHDYFPRKFYDNTIKKLNQKIQEHEIKTFNKTSPNNYHPDILRAFQLIRGQEKFNEELENYKQQIK